MKRLLTITLALTSTLSFAQDISFARKVVDTLTNPYFWGRGYTKNGMKKAADYLSGEFRAYGVKPLGGPSYFQNYSFPVNTFPDDMQVAINGKALRPGFDFIIAPESRGVEVRCQLTRKDSAHFINEENRLMISLESKLTWSVAQQEADYTIIKVDRKAVSAFPETIEVDIDNKFLKRFEAVNVCGMVQGTKVPDSIIMITAHYDHLGGMGEKTFFPGANDNASGISMLLSLAKYYAANPPAYSIGFICFSGEEAGLLGSKYFTENPLVNLDKIRFLVNLDLTGTGDEGITVVNASTFKDEFSCLTKINEKRDYLPKINARGKAANSDHYWFSEKNVPSFFIYTNGGIKAYHDVYDIAATLPLTAFNNLFKLIRDFNGRLMNE